MKQQFHGKAITVNNSYKETNDTFNFWANSGKQSPT